MLGRGGVGYHKSHQPSWVQKLEFYMLFVADLGYSTFFFPPLSIYTRFNSRESRHLFGGKNGSLRFVHSRRSWVRHVKLADLSTRHHGSTRRVDHWQVKMRKPSLGKLNFCSIHSWRSSVNRGPQPPGPTNHPQKWYALWRAYENLLYMYIHTRPA